MKQFNIFEYRLNSSQTQIIKGDFNSSITNFGYESPNKRVAERLKAYHFKKREISGKSGIFLDTTSCLVSLPELRLWL